MVTKAKQVQDQRRSAEPVFPEAFFERALFDALFMPTDALKIEDKTNMVRAGVAFAAIPGNFLVIEQRLLVFLHGFRNKNAHINCGNSDIKEDERSFIPVLTLYMFASQETKDWVRVFFDRYANLLGVNKIK